MERQGTNRPDLAQIALEYSTDLGFLMGAEIFPFFYVDEEEATFDKIATSQATKVVGNIKIGRKGTAAEIEHETTEDSYKCETYGLKEFTDYREKANLDKRFNTQAGKTRLLTRHVMIEYEKRVKALAFDAASTFVSYTGAVGTEWNNSGNPYNDIQDAKLTLIQNLGGVIDPGYELCLAISDKVAKEVRKNSNVKALLSGGQYSDDDMAKISNERLAGILDVDKVFSSPAQDGGSDIWDDEYALLFLRRTDEDLEAGVQCARTMVWTVVERSPYDVTTWGSEDPEGIWVRVRHHVDEKVLTAAAGYLMSNIHT